tara:strand:- start:10302 stop:10598 length:297 start_codon:yes stop_codon:yes gene_type:complete
MKKQELKTHKQIPIGGRIEEAGNSVKYKTGPWKAFRPITDLKKCIHCMICVNFCPEICIKIKNGKRVQSDYDFCKGCGICAAECPIKCIVMKPEGDFK